MADPGNRGRTVRAGVVPLLLSLGLHGLLFLALWLCATRSRPPALAIESTRIAVETCLLDPGSPAQSPGHSSPPHPRPEMNHEFNPQLTEAPVVAEEIAASTVPIAAPTIMGLPHRAASSSAAPRGGDPAGRGEGVTGDLFPLPPKTASVVYVLDRSVSMGVNNQLERACRELLASLRRLPPSARFQVITYNTAADPLVIDGQIDLLPADPAVLEKVAQSLSRLTAAGGTNHAKALHRGLALHPDVLYFVTDADDLPLDQIALISSFNRGTIIHTIELSRRRGPRPDGPLAELARGNGGTYRRVWAGD